MSFAVSQPWLGSAYGSDTGEGINFFTRSSAALFLQASPFGTCRELHPATLHEEHPALTPSIPGLLEQRRSYSQTPGSHWGASRGEFGPRCAKFLAGMELFLFIHSRSNPTSLISLTAVVPT